MIMGRGMARWLLQMGLACLVGTSTLAYAGEREVPFENAMWQWKEASGIEARRLDLISPHFPIPVLSGEGAADKHAYDWALERWSQLYPAEYEAFVNAPELTALNPYYSGYSRVYVWPKFSGMAILAAKPNRPEDGSSREAILHYELTLQKWLFVFQPAQFDAQWGAVPRFPEGVDVEAWRKKEQKRALDENERALQEDDLRRLESTGQGGQR